MKLILSAFLVIAWMGVTYAQDDIPDQYPGAKIYYADPQTGQQLEANDNTAMMFKDALIDLVRNDRQAVNITRQLPPAMGARGYTITPMSVESNVNGYQVSYDEMTQDPNQPINIYTFSFHIDESALYFYDPNAQQWLRQRIRMNNIFNLRRATDYANQFNAELANMANGDQQAQVDLSEPVDNNVTADTPPPAMPDYEQPECPVEGYLWQPGYWAYSPYQAGYYWVPGTWGAPPSAGLLWTPAYWGFEGGRFVYHGGYWGEHVGFYGGVNYGYGYSGRGYYGGQWQGGRFAYNTAVVRVNKTVVHNTYVNTTVINNTVINNHISYNGGGGIAARPNSEEIMAANQQHYKPTAEQNSNQLQARSTPVQFAKFNTGAKPVFASPKAIPFHPQNNNNNNTPKPAGWKTPPPVARQAAAGKPGAPATGQPSNNQRPQGQQNNGGNGQQSPANGGRSQYNPQGGRPAQPNGTPVNGGRPQSNPQGATPGQPNGTPANGGKPQNNPQGATPGQPNGTPANGGRPQNNPRGATPGQPNGTPANGGRPQNNPQGATPGQPNGTPVNGGRPVGRTDSSNGQNNKKNQNNKNKKPQQQQPTQPQPQPAQPTKQN